MPATEDRIIRTVEKPALNLIEAIYNLERLSFNINHLQFKAQAFMKGKN